MKTTKSILTTLTAAIILAWSNPTQAQPWNAYNDFYLSPTAAGWGGATTPSALGQAWGYYMGNVNGGSAFPSTIGSYLSSGQIYRYSTHDPLGAGGPVYSTSDTHSPAGLGAYHDSIPWGTSLGRYSTPWFQGAPGFSQGLTNLIWMQPNSIGNPYGEGIAAVLTWKAPKTGVFEFVGQFVSGDQPDNSAAVAIVDSVVGSSNILDGGLLSRTVLGNNSISAFSFLASYNKDDVVQFQVGSNFDTGNAVGLQVTATAIPEPSSGLLLAAGLGVLGLVRRRRS